jgi:23S rRNA-/tRNA-specific pseudouridylate synthase
MFLMHTDKTVSMPVCCDVALLCVHTDKMVVHRLDQATSGLMVLARTEEALRTLVSAAGQSRLFRKRA